jgi:hypothetical protein
MPTHTNHGTNWGAVVLLGVVFAAPWIAASVWYWRGRVRDGSVAPSLGELARRRWT